MKIDPRTPLGQLLIEKREVNRLCRTQEERIAEDWRYMRNNARRLLASELTSVFLRPGRPGGGKGKGNRSGGWELAAVAWQFARPMVFRWVAGVGWRIIRNMFVQRRRD